MPRYSMRLLFLLVVMVTSGILTSSPSTGQQVHERQELAGRFDGDNEGSIDALITDRLPMDEIDAAYEKFDKQQMGKGIIVP